MDRIDRITAHPDFVDAIRKIEYLEKDRIFCCHGLDHLLDVARIAYISALESGLPYTKEMIYATALLHDLGRAYPESERDHAELGAVLGEGILRDCGFSEDERALALSAIRKHRQETTASEEAYASLIYAADKLSRQCMYCKACSACYWPEEKKNNSITV